MGEVEAFSSEIPDILVISSFLEGKIEINDPEKLFFDIARDLGHKKYNKKKDIWETSTNITIKNYIYPEYVKEIRSRKNNIILKN